MPRSWYIYVVLQEKTPVAAFTVKRELITWLARNPGKNEVFRLLDSPSGYEGEYAAVNITEAVVYPLIPCEVTITSNGHTVSKEPWDSGLPLFDVDCSEHGKLIRRTTRSSATKIKESHQND